jgi:hypothetical protein
LQEENVSLPDTDAGNLLHKAASTSPNRIFAYAAEFPEWMKIQALSSSFGVSVIPHVWGQVLRS